MQTRHPDLLAEIESFLGARDMKPTTFGDRALGDPNFISGLKGGRRLWPETIQRVRHYIATGQQLPPHKKSTAHGGATKQAPTRKAGAA